MTAPNAQALIELLWPDGEGTDTNPVFALLDGARDQRIEPMLRFSQRQYRCLYSGRLSPGVSAAAPYVVYLARDSRFTRELLDSAWGRHWGVFIVGEAGCTHEQLRRHFRRYLRVRTEEGRVLLFRFYDPRVLPLYVGACNPIEADRFFGPVTRFVVEDPHGSPITLNNPSLPARPPVVVTRPVAPVPR